jgi:TonB family protein
MMRVRFSIGIVGTTLLLASPTMAQSVAPTPAQCDSVLRAARRDSVAVTARAFLLRRDEGLLTPRARQLLAEAILSRFVAPKPLQIPIFSPGPVAMPMLQVEHLSGDSTGLRAPILYGVYDFSLLRGGGVSKVTVAVPTLAPEFDSNVIEAILTATSDSVLVAVSRALDRDSIPLELRITTGPQDTRVRVAPTTIFKAQFPELPVVDAKPLSTNKPAAYPEEERDDGEDGEVALRVVVDAHGVPLITTMEVLHATSPAFALAAARALAEYRFAPAHVAACAVPQVVEVPFWFSLRP